MSIIFSNSRFAKNSFNFQTLDEYMGEKAQNISIGKFISGEAQFLLYSGRMHFFERKKIQSVKHVVLFDLPDYILHLPELVLKLSKTEIFTNLSTESLKILRYFGPSVLKQMSDSKSMHFSLKFE